MFSIQKNWRRAVATVFAVPMMFSIQGCNDQQALATIGAIAVIGGAVAVGVAAGSSGGGHRYYHPAPPHHGHWGRHAITMDNMAPLVEATPVAEEQETEDLNSTALMAARYGISKDAAKILKASLRESVASQSLQPIYNLGLSADDLQSISESREVSSVGINNVSAKLGLTADQTRFVMQKMMADAQQSQGNIQ